MEYKKKIVARIISQRLFITLSTLLFVRIGSYIPVPGVNHIDLALFIEKDSVTRNIANLLSGDGTFKIGLFTLNIVPYINASIITQILIKTSPYLSNLQKEADLESKRYLNRLTRFITLNVAIFQSISLGLYLRPILFDWNIELLIQIVISLTTGSMIVLWLSEIITEYGLGNGPSMLIFTNLFSTYQNISKSLVKENADSLTIYTVIINSCVFLFTVYTIVKLQESIRKVPLVSSKQLNNPILNASRSYSLVENYIPIRLNEAGILPIILTTSILVLPGYLNSIGLFPMFPQLNLPYIQKFLQIIYWFTYFVLIIVFSSFYTQISLNPRDIAEQLQKMAVAIPGVRPGLDTAFYLKRLIQRLTFIGSFLLALFATLPNIIAIIYGTSDFSGLSISSLIIATGIIIDLDREIDDILYTNIYLM